MTDILGDEILLVDKPAGMSSFAVVARVRRKLSEAAGVVEVKGKDGAVRQKRKKVKVGHTGTLDPFATGLLILLVGKGTKRAGEFLKLDKEYVTTIRLGMVSTTGDIEGQIMPFSSNLRSGLATPVFTGSLPLSSRQRPAKFLKSELNDANDSTSVVDTIPSREEVGEAVARFVGEVEQRVPAYSAVKINGQRAYKLAREGKEVEMPVRKVRIYEIEILRYEWPELEIRCKVSSGTYIRALGEDIGKALGVGGYLTALRRTQVGKYRVEDAKWKI